MARHPPGHGFLSGHDMVNCIVDRDVRMGGRGGGRPPDARRYIPFSSKNRPATGNLAYFHSAKIMTIDFSKETIVFLVVKYWVCEVCVECTRKFRPDGKMLRKC